MKMPTVALVGRPNVGKSTIFNKLVGKKISIIEDTPGVTRDRIYGDVSYNDYKFHLIDTGGIDLANADFNKEIIMQATLAIDEADLILFVVDETGIDNELFSIIKNKKHLVIYNKSDLIKDKELNKIYISAKEKDLANLISAIKKIFNIGEVTLKPSFNNTRQLGILKGMVVYLLNAIQDAEDNQPIDLISVNIMAAYNSSLDLIGENNKNDLTDEIFSRFCVGK